MTTLYKTDICTSLQVFYIKKTLVCFTFNIKVDMKYYKHNFDFVSCSILYSSNISLHYRCMVLTVASVIPKVPSILSMICKEAYEFDLKCTNIPLNLTKLVNVLNVLVHYKRNKHIYNSYILNPRTAYLVIHISYIMK